MHDQCLIITGSKDGEVIVWNYKPENINVPHNLLQKKASYRDHVDDVTAITIHQDS